MEEEIREEIREVVREELEKIFKDYDIKALVEGVKYFTREHKIGERMKAAALFDE